MVPHPKRPVLWSKAIHRNAEEGDDEETSHREAAPWVTYASRGFGRSEISGVQKLCFGD
jgi:hypothetical protein